jgi:uncharacterized protein YaiL (DUF2058 family)
MEELMDDANEALQRVRKEKIAKLERDLRLMEAQRQEDVSKEKAEVLRNGIDEAKNALDIWRVAYERKMPPQSWE